MSDLSTLDWSRCKLPEWMGISLRVDASDMLRICDVVEGRYGALAHRDHMLGWRVLRNCPTASFAELDQLRAICAQVDAWAEQELARIADPGLAVELPEGCWWERDRIRESTKTWCVGVPQNDLVRDMFRAALAIYDARNPIQTRKTDGQVEAVEVDQSKTRVCSNCRHKPIPYPKEPCKSAVWATEWHEDLDSHRPGVRDRITLICDRPILEPGKKDNNAEAFDAIMKAAREGKKLTLSVVPDKPKVEPKQPSGAVRTPYDGAQSRRKVPSVRLPEGTKIIEYASGPEICGPTAQGKKLVPLPVDVTERDLMCCAILAADERDGKARTTLVVESDGCRRWQETPPLDAGAYDVIIRKVPEVKP